MHRLIGSSRHQVCDVFWMSHAKPRLMGFLCLLSLCRQRRFVCRVVSAAHPRIPMAAIICQGTHLSTGSDQRQVCGRLWMSLVNPALMEISELTGGEQRHLLLLTARQCFLLTGRQCFLLCLQTLGGGGALPFRPQLRGRGQRHLLAPFTSSGILEGGYWGCVSDTITCSR